MNYYKILGISEEEKKLDVDSFKKILKKKYRTKSMEHHPDKNQGDADAADRFKDVASAYEILSNSEKRSEYDMRNNSPFGAESGNPMMDDFMNMFRQNANIFQKGADIVVTFPIDLEDVLKGSHFNRSIVRKLSNGQTQTYQPNLKIPSGVNHGESFVKGRGGHYAQGHGAGAGGLVIVIAVRPHSIFIREGADLIYKQQLNFHEFIEGKEIMVPLLEGGKAKVKVKAGTKSDAVLSLKGKGLPVKHDSPQRGNILVHLSVYIPEDIDENEQELLESIKKSKSFVET